MAETCGEISMLLSPVLTKIEGFSYILVIVSRLWDKSYLFQSNAICTYMDHMWLERWSSSVEFSPGVIVSVDDKFSTVSGKTSNIFFWSTQSI